MPAPALLEPLVPVLAHMHPVGIRLPHQGAREAPALHPLLEMARGTTRQPISVPCVDGRRADLPVQLLHLHTHQLCRIGSAHTGPVCDIDDHLDNENL